MIICLKTQCGYAVRFMSFRRDIITLTFKTWAHDCIQEHMFIQPPIIIVKHANRFDWYVTQTNFVCSTCTLSKLRELYAELFNPYFYQGIVWSCHAVLV